MARLGPSHDTGGRRMAPHSAPGLGLSGTSGGLCLRPHAIV